jgi:hypothetical protein
VRITPFLLLGIGSVSVATVTAAYGFALTAFHSSRRRPIPIAARAFGSSYSWIVGIWKKWVGRQIAFASRLAPTEQQQQEQEQEQEQKIAAFGSSYSWIVGIWEKWVARQAAFASRLAPTEKQSSEAARGEAAPLNNERKLE